ncbi:hypothetical protein [Nonomuraea insulae]|uniref:Secreted protein n=1 Tax=Nonomuraea insulae TaxID=1616787 RepID=A0ABW1CDE6_9ACTN
MGVWDFLVVLPVGVTVSVLVWVVVGRGLVVVGVGVVVSVLVEVGLVEVVPGVVTVRIVEAPPEVRSHVYHGELFT